MSSVQAIMPNTEKLFMYVQRGFWHNITPSSTGFVKKEYFQYLTELQADEEDYKQLRLMIEHAEMGRYTEAKNLMNDAYTQFQNMVSLVMEKRQGPPYSPRKSSRQGRDNMNGVDQTRQTLTPNYGRNEDTYRGGTPRRLEAPHSPSKDQNRANRGRDTPPRSPLKNQDYSNQDRMATPLKANQQDARYTVGTPDRASQVGTPRTPLQQTNRENASRDGRINASRDGRVNASRDGRNNASRDGRVNASRDGRNIISRGGRSNFDYDSEEEKERRQKLHKENYDLLRVHSPDKKAMDNRFDPQLPRTPGTNREPSYKPDDRGYREQSYKSGDLSLREPSYKHGAADQQKEHRDLWGLEYGDTDKDKTARDSTYRSSNLGDRQSFPKYDIESLERQDKLRYRNNFNSLAERETWFRDNITSSEESSRNGSGTRSYRRKSEKKPNKTSPSKRMLETPDSNPHTATELAKKFRELYLKEWQDAYDEICKTFGPERTVRHLLWIVTESSLVANEIASTQMRDLEKSAFGVMRTPGPDKEHPSEGPLPRNTGEAIPKSRSLLLRYRRQTADLSVPYVKEECRTRICDTLIESSNFPRTFLSSNTRLMAYINKCAEITWLFCVQDPPLVLGYVTKTQEGARFDNDLYTQYGKPGLSFDYGVWPLLRQDKGGPIISKGIAQGI